MREEGSGTQEMTVKYTQARPGCPWDGPVGSCPSSAGSRLLCAHFRNMSEHASRQKVILVLAKACENPWMPDKVEQFVRRQRAHLQD